MKQLDRFDAALAANKELPVLSELEFLGLMDEVAASQMSEAEIAEINHYLYKGQGFGVDSNIITDYVYVPVPTPPEEIPEEVQETTAPDEDSEVTGE